MLGKPKKYIINTAHLEDPALELVGKKALILAQIEKLSIPVPQGFIIVSTAFDDFVLANDLVGFISPRINDIDYTDKGSVKKASFEIRKAIIAAPLPDIIREPIEKSYAGLSGLLESFVMLVPSPINNALDETSFGPPSRLANVKGKEQLEEKLKLLWSTLFTESALEYRSHLGYEGSLTLPVLVQKMVQAEASGRVYTQNPTDGDNNVSEIQAVLGLPDAMLSDEIVPDSYFFDKKTEDILEKKIVGQEWMLVRKGRSADADPNIKVAISDLWRKKQKLDDRFILSLARIGMSLEKLYKEPQEVEFAVEGGKVYITQTKSMKLAADTSPIPVQSGRIARNKIAIKPVEAEPVTAKTIDEYVDEVTKLQSLPAAPVEPQPVEETPEQVVVNILPLDELNNILSGVGSGKELRFGLVHFVFNDSDYQNLTGDEILVIEAVNPHFQKQINSVHGVIIKNTLSEQELEYIHVPAVHSVPTVFDILQENEVVTVDPSSGKIYLGAGKQTEAKPEPKTAAAKSEAETTAPVTTPAVGEVTFKPVQTLSDETTTTRVRTSTHVWQLFSPDNPIIDLVNADGAFVNLNGFYLLAGFAPYALLGDPELKRVFIKEVVDQLKPVLMKLEGRPVLVQASSLDYESIQHLPGSEAMNQKYGKLSGAQYIAKTPEIFTMELEVLSILRNRESLKNVWLSLPYVQTEAEQAEIKKTVSSFGFRRSSTFKLLSTIGDPMGAIAVKSLLENDIDGIVIDLDRLFSRFNQTTAEEINPSLMSFINWMLDTIHSHNSTSYVLINETAVPKPEIKELLGHGLANIIVSQSNLLSTKMLLSTLEVSRIELKRKKRGRKKKKIDYGF